MVAAATGSSHRSIRAPLDSSGRNAFGVGPSPPCPAAADCSHDGQREESWQKVPEKWRTGPSSATEVMNPRHRRRHNTEYSRSHAQMCVLMLSTWGGNRLLSHECQA